MQARFAKNILSAGINLLISTNKNPSRKSSAMDFYLTLN